MDAQTARLRIVSGTMMVISLTMFLSGCRARAPIYVWRPAKVTVPKPSRIALAPVAGDMQLAAFLEQALMQQRPAARSDIAILTSQQLAQVSPVRLASTAALSNDLIALQAARAAGADLVLCGQVIDGKLDFNNASPASAPQQNMNQVFFQRLGKNQTKDPGFHLVMAWNVLDTRTGKLVGSNQFKITSRDLVKKYPDLQVLQASPTEQLITACARESWRTLAPTVEKEEVRLAVSFLQPGSWRVWRGVRAAKKGQWQLAEQYWQSAADGLLPSPAAHHNLAIAKASREQFQAAKAELQSATGLLSRRLPPETLVWLDYNHRLYHQAHQLGTPSEGWSFPTPYNEDDSMLQSQSNDN